MKSVTLGLASSRREDVHCVVNPRLHLESADVSSRARWAARTMKTLSDLLEDSQEHMLFSCVASSRAYGTSPT
jgi:hypothetical protein